MVRQAPVKHGDKTGWKRAGSWRWPAGGDGERGLLRPRPCLASRKIKRGGGGTDQAAVGRRAKKVAAV